MKRIETVIVGGGPAGAATACGLASMGREVMLVERAGAPHHKVCGEFLSIETQAQLRRLGVDPMSLGAVPIDHVAVYSSARSVMAELPFRALSLSRYRLDDTLLCRAQERGAQVKRSVSVRTVIAGWTRHGESSAMTAKLCAAVTLSWRPANWDCVASAMRATTRWSD